MTRRPTRCLSGSARKASNPSKRKRWRRIMLDLDSEGACDRDRGARSERAHDPGRPQPDGRENDSPAVQVVSSLTRNSPQSHDSCSFGTAVTDLEFYPIRSFINPVTANNSGTISEHLLFFTDCHERYGK